MPILSWQYRLNMAKSESILWLARTFKKIVLLCKSVKIHASFFTRKFQNGFYHFSPDSKCWSPVSQEFHFKVSPRETMNAHSPGSPAGEDPTPASVTCFFWSPNKNSSTTSFKLKGKEAFPPAGRLFPSDKALSHLKRERKTRMFTRLS